MAERTWPRYGISYQQLQDMTHGQVQRVIDHMNESAIGGFEAGEVAV